MAGIDTSRDPVYLLVLDYFLKNITEIGRLIIAVQGDFMENTNETDPDFNEKMQTAIFRMNNAGEDYKDVSNLFAYIEAPNYDLSIGVYSNLLIMTSLFMASTFKTITIDHNAEIQASLISSNPSDIIEAIAVERIFNTTKAEKVTIKIDPYSSGHGIDGGWYMLAGIDDGYVDTFDVGYTSPISNGDGRTSIDFVAEKILPDLSQNDHKPKLIFRNVVGTVNEELKQKILSKGYLSVEFYEGENKVL